MGPWPISFQLGLSSSCRPITYVSLRTVLKLPGWFRLSPSYLFFLRTYPRPYISSIVFTSYFNGFPVFLVLFSILALIAISKSHRTQIVMVVYALSVSLIAFWLFLFGIPFFSFLLLSVSIGALAVLFMFTHLFGLPSPLSPHRYFHFRSLWRSMAFTLIILSLLLPINTGGWSLFLYYPLDLSPASPLSAVVGLFLFDLMPASIFGFALLLFAGSILPSLFSSAASDSR